MVILKIIIAGGREFFDYILLKKTSIQIITELSKQYKITSWSQLEIVSGGASGADALGERLAKELGLKVVSFYVDWNTYGKSAGPRRNKQMAKYADVLIAYHNGKSRGTKNMIDIAQENDLQVFVINY